MQIKESRRACDSSENNPKRGEEAPRLFHLISHHEADGSCHALCGEYLRRPDVVPLNKAVVRRQLCAACIATEHLMRLTLEAL